MFDFTGQVAVVTGAGRGIGREYALMLASRGARVVVNDIGADVQGRGTDPTVARSVAAEIELSGRTAVSDPSDVSTVEGGRSLIDHAVDEFGQLDIVIHNAGSLRRAPFSEIDDESLHSVIGSHLLGAFYVGRPAWREMERRGYGRILLTTSVALFGAPDLSVYASAKAACVSLAKSLALEAERSNLDIRANSISPTASTRRSSFSHRNDSEAAKIDEAFGDRMHPRNVAAAALPLVSRECPFNGECLKVGGGSAARIFFGLTTGWASEETYLTPEAVMDRFREIMSVDGYGIPSSSANARERTLAALSSQAAGRNSQSSPGSGMPAPGVDSNG